MLSQNSGAAVSTRDAVMLVIRVPVWTFEFETKISSDAHATGAMRAKVCRRPGRLSINEPMINAW
jgi:hypothetical protein